MTGESSARFGAAVRYASCLVEMAEMTGNTSRLVMRIRTLLLFPVALPVGIAALANHVPSVIPFAKTALELMAVPPTAHAPERTNSRSPKESVLRHVLFTREQVISHRAGGTRKKTENTVRAIRAAIDSNAAWIELDVQLTRDHELVVFHDSTLLRATDHRGFVAGLDLAELRKVRTRGGEPIPTLEEALGAVAGRAGVVLDIKVDGTVDALAKLIDERVESGVWRYEQFIVSSYDQRALKRMRSLSPRTPRAVLVEGVPLSMKETYDEVAPAFLFLHKDYIRAEMLEEAHRHSVKVFAFTVNCPLEAARLSREQLDGIVSDKPERAVSVEDAVEGLSS